jgi:hypothetical protein
MKEVKTIEGRTLLEISIESGITKTTIWSRYRKGWSLDRIMSTPVNPKMNRKGKRPSLVEQAEVSLIAQPDPYIQSIAPKLTPQARVFCGVAYSRGNQYDNNI